MRLPKPLASISSLARQRTEPRSLHGPAPPQDTHVIENVERMLLCLPTGVRNARRAAACLGPLLCGVRTLAPVAA